LDAALIPGWSSRAEDVGFSTLATLGRIAYPGVMDTVALAAAAAATQRIGLSSNIMLSTVWPAPLLAKELAGVDALSGGRLTLGLGIGGDRPDDFVVEGLPARGLGRRMDSDLDTFQRIWRGDPVGGGMNAAVPATTRQIPMMFGGMSAASFRRMATWGEGYIAGALPTSAIEPMFAAARQAWRDAKRDGDPRLVAMAYFVFRDVERGRSNIRDYYDADGDEFANAQAQSVHAGADAIRAAIDSFKATGADELILHPAVADVDEVEKLADVVLR
jgi:alkanesulfonate monooxygenase SsuD/methylene tetrahydromethanopterin reductase-like flavin-dependent oxidoreductase (luciferase family)